MTLRPTEGKLRPTASKLGLTAAIFVGYGQRHRPVQLRGCGPRLLISCARIHEAPQADGVLPKKTVMAAVSPNLLTVGLNLLKFADFEPQSRLPRWRFD